MDGERRDAERSADPIVEYVLAHPALFTAIGSALLFSAKALWVARLEPATAMTLVTASDTAQFIAGMLVSITPTMLGLFAIIAWLRWAVTAGRSARIYLAAAIVLTVVSLPTSPFVPAGLLLIAVAVILLLRRHGRERLIQGTWPIGVGGALGLLTFYLFAGPVWLPTEVVDVTTRSFPGGGGTSESIPYYVLEEDGDWLTAFDADEANIVRIRLSAVNSRTVCHRDYRVPAALIHVFFPPADVPECGRGSASSRPDD